MKLSIVALVLSAVQMNVWGRASMKISLNRRPSLAVNGVLDLSSLQAHVAYATSKYAIGFAAYKRNTGSDHPLATKENTHTHKHVHQISGAVPLTIEGGGIYWQGPINVGLPPRQFTVDFDTGSSDLILPGPICGATCTSHARYYPALSNTSHDAHIPFTIMYGDGSVVTGEEYADIVSAAGLSVINQPFGAAEIYPPAFQVPRFLADGLLGMAFSTISVVNATTFFENLYLQNLGEFQPVFGFKLSQTGSELFLGGTNPALYTGPVTYAPVTVPAYWQVVLDAVDVNVTVGININSVIDTGTTLILGDPTTVAALYATIPGSAPVTTMGPAGQGFYTIPCAEAPFVLVSLTFGGTSFTIDPAIFNLGPLAPGSPDCVGGIMATTIVPFWIIGDIFLQNVYTAFDMGLQRVGFANLAPPPLPPPRA